MSISKVIGLIVGLLIGFVIGFILASYWNDPGARPAFRDAPTTGLIAQHGDARRLSYLN